MRILVTGSRDWTDHRIIAFALTLAAGAVHPGTVTLVVGDARGADTIAELEAQARGWKVEIHGADWDKNGRSAGIIRNLDMVRSGADVCLAFIRNHSRGATHCATAAEAVGIPVTRYEINDGGDHESRGDSPDRPAPGEARVPREGYPSLPADASADYAGVPDWPVLTPNAHYHCIWEGGMSMRPDGTWNTWQRDLTCGESNASVPS